ncbi:glycoside hydrolase family 2 protein [Streptococcus hillyeri]|nr:glycoside hydrolase family 2 TIM barrel-domain containing protein [Streptococcus hillyeri]
MRKITLLNDNWQFDRLSKKEYDNQSQPVTTQSVTIPHTWYEEGVGDNTGYGYYRTVLQKDDLASGYHFIRFQAVSLIATVLFNGQKIGYHEGGYSAFTVALPTDNLQEENVLEVFVSNIVSDEISPAAGDFTVFGGIHRRVEWLQFDTDDYFDVTYFGTDGVIVKTSLEDSLEQGHLVITPKVIKNAPEGSYFKAVLQDVDGNIVDSWVFNEELDVIINHPILWNGLENPYLYTVTVTYETPEAILDSVTKSVGFRQIQLSSSSGFYLNGQKVRLNGVARHNDSAVVYSAITDDEITRDFEMIKEIGANAIRLSHYQHPTEVYQKSDEEGYLVWAEIPLLKVHLTDVAKANAKQQMAELLLQNANHPSICFWGVQNEVAIYTEDDVATPFVEEVKAYAESLDQTRVFTVANLFSVKPESPLNQTTKMVGYNIYFGWYYGKMQDYGTFLDDCHEKLPAVALGVSEYGVDANKAFHSLDPKVRDYTEEFQALYHETVYPQIEARDYLWGSFIWNMFDFSSSHRDEGGIKYRNLKGLVTYDRQKKKDAFYYYKAKWAKQPFVHLAGKDFSKRTGDVLVLKAYSNQKQIIFEVMGQHYSVASKTGVFTIEVPFTEQELTVRVTAGTVSDWSVFTKVTELPEEYTYKDAHPGVNVQNWFETDEEKEKLFPEDVYSIMDSTAVLLSNAETLSVLEKLMPKHIASMIERGGNMPLHRVIFYMREAYSEEDVQKINEGLKKIKKIT